MNTKPLAAPARSTHYCSRTFENSIAHSHGVFEACKAHPEIRPDLIVGHSGFGSTLFLPELFPDVPVVNYFEYYYHPHGSDMDFRPEFPPAEIDFLRAGHATRWFCSTWSTADRAIARRIFSAISSRLNCGTRSPSSLTVSRPKSSIAAPRCLRRVGDRIIAPSTRVVTYVSRGFESMRGFDIFMKTAKRIYERYPDVVFVVIGSDRICYGGDEKHIRHQTFREHVLAQDNYDLSKFIFTGMVPTHTLVDLFSLSELHIYLTVPFVLSWSLLDALACGCTVLASDTAPVREVIADGKTGLLADFFDVESLAEKAVAVLKDPAAYRHLGERSTSMVHERDALDVTLPKLIRWFERNLAGNLP